MSDNFTNNDFSSIVFGRKSVRGYDESYKIPHKEMLEMIQEASTAPSSVNLQPWRMVVVESDEAKAKLKPLIRFTHVKMIHLQQWFYFSVTLNAKS